MSHDRVTFGIFLKEKTELVSGSWSSNAKQLLSSQGCELSWDLNLPINIDDARKKLMDNYNAVWLNEIKTKSKLENMVKMKKAYETATFLKMDLDKCKRSLVAQLRNGILPLEIETSRYQGIVRGDCKCKICNLDEIESELHFLFRCPLYLQKHIELYHRIPHLLNVQCEVKKFEILCEQPYVMSNYVYYIWKQHETMRNRVCNNHSDRGGYRLNNI